MAEGAVVGERKPEIVAVSDWSIVYCDDHEYRAPEQRRQSLYGVVKGHPAVADGSPATTSPIASVDVKKRLVTTASGRVYRVVGPPDPRYSKWLKEHPHLAGSGDLAKLVEAATRVRKPRKKAAGR